MKVKEYTPKQKQSIFKSKKFYTYLIGLGIILLMVSSALTYYAKDDNEEIEYNGHLFFNDGRSWFTNYEGQRLTFLYLPEELEGIEVEDFSLTPKSYLISDENSQSEIQRLSAFLRFKGINLQLACESEDCIDDELPIVDCNSDSSVIKLKTSESNSIIKDNSCIIINYNNSKVFERFIFKVLGIM